MRIHIFTHAAQQLAKLHLPESKNTLSSTGELQPRRVPAAAAAPLQANLVQDAPPADTPPPLALLVELA